MRTNEIAKKANVHPNTVRLYEEWHYISPVPRQANGYRVYNDVHLQQMYIARLAFRQEFVQNNLRKRATKIVQLSGQEKFQESLLMAHDYLQFLRCEAQYAEQAVATVTQLLQHQQMPSHCFTHRQVAQHLQVTEETIRNWERNGLFTVTRNTQNRRQYTTNDVHKLLIIRTLRSAHFSLTSIRQLFDGIDTVTHISDIHSLLNSASFTKEFYHVTDELELNLKKAIADVLSIIAILETLH